MRCLLPIYIWIYSRWKSITLPKLSRYRLRGLNHHSRQLEQVLRRMHAYEDEIEQVNNLDERLALAAKIESLHQVAISLDRLMNKEEGK